MYAGNEVAYAECDSDSSEKWEVVTDPGPVNERGREADRDDKSSAQPLRGEPSRSSTSLPYDRGATPRPCECSWVHASGVLVFVSSRWGWKLSFFVFLSVCFDILVLCFSHEMCDSNVRHASEDATCGFVSG